MHRVTRRAWIGLSAAVVGDATLSPSSAQDQVAAPATRTGGEPYLRDGGPSDTRVRITRDLILFKGHLFVFDERIAAKDWPSAQRRIDDATLELRERVEPYMKGQGVRPFTPQIDEIRRAIDRRDVKAIAAVRARLAAKTIEVDKAFAKFRRPYRHFGLRGAIEAMKVAAKAYEAAISEGAFVQADEYQDGRGAKVAVDAVLARLRAELFEIDASAASRLFAEATAIAAAWPTPAMPTTPVLPTDALTAHIEAMETAAEPFWAKSP